MKQFHPTPPPSKPQPTQTHYNVNLTYPSGVPNYPAERSFSTDSLLYIFLISASLLHFQKAQKK